MTELTLDDLYGFGGGIRVLHLDHTVSRGGAEMALARMLVNPLWTANLLLPKRASPALEAFAHAAALGGVVVRHVGPAQFSGASKSTASHTETLGFALRIIGQAIAVRLSPEYRRADVVHANSSRAALYGALACIGSKKRLVVHLRDTVDQASLGHVGFFAFTRVALRRANGVIGNSHATLASAAPHIRPSTPRRVIASAAGLDLNSVVADAGGPFTTVGMVARLEPWKGQGLLIEAFAEAFAGTSVKLKFAGGPHFGNEAYPGELRALAQELAIAAQVEFLGHIDDVSRFIDDLQICVQASLKPEPLGQNVLQYLSRGRATIAVDVGGPTEWIVDGHNGVLVSMGDRESLARALRELGSDADLRLRLAANARATPGLCSDRDVAEAHLRFFALVAGARERDGQASAILPEIAAQEGAPSGEL